MPKAKIIALFAAVASLGTVDRSACALADWATKPAGHDTARPVRQGNAEEMPPSRALFWYDDAFHTSAGLQQETGVVVTIRGVPQRSKGSGFAILVNGREYAFTLKPDGTATVSLP